MITSKDILLIGTIARTHGKQGELQVRTLNEYWDDSDADFLILMLDAIPVPFRVLEWRVKGADLLFTLQDIATEQDALRLVGCEVYMLRRDIATTDDNTILCWIHGAGVRHRRHRRYNRQCPRYALRRSPDSLARRPDNRHQSRYKNNYYESAVRIMNNTKLTIPEMHRLTVDEFHAADKVPLIVVLDNVRSQHNVGAVFRTADAFRLQAVYLCGICCCPPNAEIHKTALGAEETVPFRYFADTLAAVKALKEAGYRVLAIEQAHNSIDLDTFQTTVPTAVILGHEVFGVQQAVIDACDGCIEIAQYGTKHSLNVSVTAGIVLYKISQQLRS